MTSRSCRGLAFAATLLAIGGVANAQKGQGAALGGQPMPDVYTMNALIRTTIIALNQANQTGNYTVLLDLGAPAFRARNNSGRLAGSFSGIRRRQVDLSPVVFYDPKLIAPPRRDQRGMLRLTGFIPTSPERVNFDLIFQPVDGRWRIFGIGVSLSPAESAAVRKAPPQETKAAARSGKQQDGRTPRTKVKDALAKAASKKERRGSEKSERPSSPRKEAAAQPPSRQESAAARDRTVGGARGDQEVTRIDLATPAGSAGARNADAPNNTVGGSGWATFWGALTGSD